jgi:hypothetical protein
MTQITTQEEKSSNPSISNICFLLGKLDISPEVQKDLLTSLLVPPFPSSNFALVFTNSDITDDPSAIAERCLLVDNYDSLPDSIRCQPLIPLTEQQYNLLKPFTRSERKVYLKVMLARSSEIPQPIDIQSDRLSTLTRSLGAIGKFCALFGIEGAVTLPAPQTKAFLGTDCKGPIISGEGICYAFSTTEDNMRVLIEMIFHSRTWAKYKVIAEWQYKLLLTFTPTPLHYKISFPLGSNTKLENKTNQLRQLATKELRDFSVVGPFYNHDDPFLLLKCDAFFPREVKSLIKKGKNLLFVDIGESKHAFLSTYPLSPTIPTLPSLPDDKYYVMVSFQDMEEHIQPIHLGNYKTHFYRMYPNHAKMNLQIKGPFSSLYQSDEHCMLISVDKRFKDAIFTDIIGYEKRRATPITKEQFDEGEYPDVETIPNCKHKNFKIRVSAKEFSKNEQVQKLEELKKFFHNQHRKPDRIEGPMEDNGENILVLYNADFWWAEWFFRDIYLQDIRFFVELISYENKD